MGPANSVLLPTEDVAATSHNVDTFDTNLPMSRRTKRTLIIGVAVVAGLMVLIMWDQHVSLEGEMHSMEGDYRIILRQVKDSTKNASTLAAIQDLELHTLKAKGCTPDAATTMPSAVANTRKLNAYRGELAAVLQRELKLEQQLVDGDNGGAAVTAASLDSLEQQGHHDFRGDDN